MMYHRAGLTLLAELLERFLEEPVLVIGPHYLPLLGFLLNLI